MSKRKKYIIDKKYQVKTAFSVILVATIITSAILGIIAASVFYNNTKIENIYEIENQIVTFLSSRSTSNEDESLRRAIVDVDKNHHANMVTLKTIMTYNRALLIAIVLIVVLQGFVLYFVLIRRTHRVSGPIYVMSTYMKEIIDGRQPRFRSLRKNDELKDFYELFKLTVQSLKNERKK